MGTYPVAAVRGKNFLAPAAFSPLSLSPVVWLKADALALSNDDPVGTWTDSSGNGNDLTQGTAGSKPLYKTNSLNGLPSVLFDGSDDFLRHASVALTNPISIYLMLKEVTWTDVDAIMDSGTVLEFLQVLQLTATPNLTMFAGSLAPSSTDLVVGSYGILECIFNGASSSIAVNGGSSTTGDAGTSTPHGITLGALSGDDHCGNIQVVEMIVFHNQTLSAGNRTNIKNYLNARGAIY